MVAKIAKWLALILALKLAAVLIITQFDADPRKNVEGRSTLCRAFKPNTVFIGTSRTLYGVNPALFDSLSDFRTRSYNFGIFSLPSELALQVADDLIVHDRNIKTIYIELSALDHSTVSLTPGNFFQDLAFRTNVMAGATRVDRNQQLAGFFAGLNTTLFQVFSIAPEISIIRKAFSPGSDPIEGKPGLRANGYQPVSRSLTQVDKTILKNEQSTRQMLARNSRSIPNTFYISKINGLIAKAARMKKSLIFFYPNNLTQAEYLILSEVAPFLPEQNLVRLPQDQQLNEFFKPQNLFDAHHLNQQGASIYTRFLQKESSKRRHKVNP